jgi:hypothetical protein
VDRSTLEKLSILNDHIFVTLTDKPDRFWMAGPPVGSEGAMNAGIELPHRLVPIGFRDILITSPINEIAPWPHVSFILLEEPRQPVGFPPWIASKATVTLLPGFVCGKVRRSPGLRP